ncbi:MAG: helix-turn-helix domain-containing protein [Bryobacterales bacterium]|nr:helix-turn-helix domain-containing protein [Bryobacterales bacterium]
MATVGETLKRERERQGLDLATIAQRTRIKLQYLQALERNDFDSLPGRFFARSFATQYAEHLGVNTDQLQAEIQKEITPPEIFSSTPPNAGSIAPSRDFYVDPLPEGSASAVSARKLTASFVMLAAVIVACGAIFWLWQRSQISSTLAESGEPVPAAKQTVSSQLPETVSPPAAQPIIPQASPTPTPAPTQLPVMGEQAPGSVPPPVVNALAGRIKIAVVAKEPTWLRITVDGKVAVEKVLTAGESSVTAGNDTARILLGNAGGVDVQFNGASIGAVGPRGQVRTVDFTPDKFTIVEPIKKPVAPAPATPVAEAL